MTMHTSVAFLGCPNGGKSTLFNALTLSMQRVGNWSGVTVSAQHANFTLQGVAFRCVDLPGCHDLGMASDEACDQKVTHDLLMTSPPDMIINVVDASQLMRHLYLTLQILEMGIPIVLVLNKIDLAKKKGISIDTKALSLELGCTVVTTVAHRQQGMDGVMDACMNICQSKQKGIVAPLTYPACIEQAIVDIRQHLSYSGLATCKYTRWLAISMLEHFSGYANQYVEKLGPRMEKLQGMIQQSLGESADIAIADLRYRRSVELTKHVIVQSHQRLGKSSWSLDAIVLHQWLSLPIFLLVMLLLFVVTIGIGGCFQPAVEALGQYFFVDGLANILMKLSFPDVVVNVLTDGIGQGLVITLTFVPVLAALFMCLSVIEDSGYLARIAFVMDGVMCRLGLPGKAFISMILGFGCNVPAIMAARSLDSKNDRIVTVMMAPFMSCSGRLAIYAVFASAFFPYGGHIILLMLYLLGIAAALLTAAILRFALLSGKRTPLVMDLPPYQVPMFANMIVRSGRRLWAFVRRALRAIIPVCLLLSVLSHVSWSGGMIDTEHTPISMLAGLSHFIGPVFVPMGISGDNWQAIVALFTGVLAKEVVIATLGSLYDPMGAVQAMHVMSDLSQLLSGVGHGILERLQEFPYMLMHPGQIFTSGPQDMPSHIMGALLTHFHTRYAALSYMVFVLLYLPCIATLWAVSKELGRCWGGFSFLWSLLLAYGLSAITYQMMTFTQHIWYSSMVIMCVLLVWGLVLALLWGVGRSSMFKRYNGQVMTC